MGRCVSLITASVLLPAKFEQSGKPFDQFLPTMLERLPEYSR